MKYRLLDNQHTTKIRTFNTKEEILEHLRSYHSADLESADKMTLNDLLEIGDWAIEETPENMYYLDVITRLREGYDNDGDNQTLEDAMNYYCSLWDIREGYKHAIITTLRDQYENHAGEQDENDLNNLLEKLKLK